LTPDDTSAHSGVWEVDNTFQSPWIIRPSHRSSLWDVPWHQAPGWETCCTQSCSTQLPRATLQFAHRPSLASTSYPKGRERGSALTSGSRLSLPQSTQFPSERGLREVNFCHNHKCTAWVFPFLPPQDLSPRHHQTVHDISATLSSLAGYLQLLHTFYDSQLSRASSTIHSVKSRRRGRSEILSPTVPYLSRLPRSPLVGLLVPHLSQNSICLFYHPCGSCPLPFSAPQYCIKRTNTTCPSAA
jgi:hypothetical protein